MLEKSIDLGTQGWVSVNSISHEENDAYDKALKGSIHAVILPLIIGVVFGGSVGLSYFITAAVLYGTVFRHKSQGFWSVTILVAMLGLLMIVGGVR